jgi:hypothetical protein
MEQHRGTFKVNLEIMLRSCGDFRHIVNFSPRLKMRALAISCQKIRHSANIAQLVFILPRKHTVSLVRKWAASRRKAVETGEIRKRNHGLTAPAVDGTVLAIPLTQAAVGPFRSV